MSRRTQHLPSLTGLAHHIREWRHKEVARQSLGVLLIPVYSLLAQPDKWVFYIGAVLALSGMLVRLYASGFIVKNKELATYGPYSLVRHPLYTGNLLLMIGFTLVCGQWWAVVVSGLFWWFYYPPAIAYEDHKLHGIFGEAWETWSETVPAVIPADLKFSAGGGWSLTTSFKQNYEFLVVLFTVFWVLFVGRQFV